MRDSILRVIDDLETKLARTKAVQDGCNTDIGTAVAEGIILGSEYAIHELRKVLDDHGKMDR